MEKNNSNEINLLQLIALSFNWLSEKIISVFKFFGFLVRLTYRHLFISIVLISISLGIGLYLSRPSVRIYKAESMAMLNGSEAQTVKEVCKQLENSISTNQHYSLSTLLLIPDSIANNIVGFQSFYVINSIKNNVAGVVDFENNHSLTDTLNVRMKDRLYIRMLSKNINQIPQVQIALLNYFNRIPLMKAQFVNKRNQLLQKIMICDSESKRIDSLEKISYFINSNSQLRFDKDKLLIGEQKKQLFYEDLLMLQNIKYSTELKLAECNQPMVLPSEFSVNIKPLNGTFKYCMIGFLIGYILSLIISLLIENFTNITNYLNKK